MKINYSNPQKAHPWRKTRLLRVDFGDDSSAGATYRRAEENKKEKKKKTKTVENWLFAQTTHVVGSKSYFAWWVACGVQFYISSAIQIS